MRSQEEIRERIIATMPGDPLGLEWPEYVCAITKESAMALRGIALQSGADLRDWRPVYSGDDKVLDRCKTYMEYAWSAANDRRTVQSERAMAHYRAWLWLLGEDGFDDMLIGPHSHYGKDALVKICAHLGLDSSQWDDGIRGAAR